MILSLTKTGDSIAGIINIFNFAVWNMHCGFRLYEFSKSLEIGKAKILKNENVNQYWLHAFK